MIRPDRFIGLHNRRFCSLDKWFIDQSSVAKRKASNPFFSIGTKTIEECGCGMTYSSGIVAHLEPLTWVSEGVLGAAVVVAVESRPPLILSK